MKWFYVASAKVWDELQIQATTRLHIKRRHKRACTVWFYSHEVQEAKLIYEEFRTVTASESRLLTGKGVWENFLGVMGTSYIFIWVVVREMCTLKILGTSLQVSYISFKKKKSHLGGPWYIYNICQSTKDFHIHHFSWFFKKILFNWSIITLQYCDCFLPYISNESVMGIHVFPHLELPLPPSSPPYPSGLSQSTSFGYPASCIELTLVISFTYGNIHVSMLFSQIIPPSPFPRVQKSGFHISVSFAAPQVGSSLLSF